jgi:adenosine deaminase
MKEKITYDFISKIPKTDLHLHLDGSLRLETLIELAKKESVKLPAYTKEGLKKLVFKDYYKNLPEYLEGFGYTCAVLQNPENLERTAYELAQDNIAEGVRYIEVRFAPQLHTANNMTMSDSIRAVIKGLEKAKKEHNQKKEVRDNIDVPFHFGVIVCAMRRFNKQMSPYFYDFLNLLEHAPKEEVYSAASLELARTAANLVDKEKLPIVGFDLAGEEAGFPAIDHKEAYQYAHSNFIRKTVHAGEAYGPESIFQAITECYANRIGHGTFLFAKEMIKDRRIKDKTRFVENLSTYIASQRIAIEVCLTSNLQTTPSIKNVKDHPMKEMLDHNLSITVCTDNRLVSNTSVSNEMRLAVENFGLDRHQLRNLTIAGFKSSFFPGLHNEKREFVKKVIKRYEYLESRMLTPIKKTSKRR